MFQLEFTGVGQIGTDRGGAAPESNVPGYSVTNRADPALAPPSRAPRLPFEQVY